MGRPRYWDVRRAVRKSTVELGFSQIVDALRDSHLRELNMIGLDSRYRAISQEAWELVLAYNGVDREKYKSEHFDCDNFAICLAGDVMQRWEINGIGIVFDYSAGHAYNCVLVATDDGIVVATVEPQNDAFVLDRGLYRARNGTIYFA